MSKIAQAVVRLHAPAYRIQYRMPLMVFAFYHVGLLMWDPHQYAASMGGFNFPLTVLFIWSSCSAMIFGVGFQPHRWGWQLFFSPYLSAVILLAFLGMKWLPSGGV